VNIVIYQYIEISSQLYNTANLQPIIHAKG